MADVIRDWFSLNLVAVILWAACIEYQNTQIGALK